MIPVLAIVSVVAQLLPLVHQVVPLVERIFPDTGSGARKLDYAAGLIEQLLPVLGIKSDNNTTAVIRQVIEAVVAVMNATGMLKAPVEERTVG